MFYTLGAFIAFTVFALAWVGIRGALAVGHLNDVRMSAPELVSSFTSDPSEATEQLRLLADDTGAARSLTSDAVWRLLERAPWIGPQLEAVRVVTASSDDLVRLSALPLVEAIPAGALDALKPVDGRIDVSSLTILEGPATDAAAQATKALTHVRSIDRTPLMGRLAYLTDQVEQVFAQSVGAFDAVSRASQLLPDMLGGAGARSYLILVQNNAEFRSLGGITGTALLLQTENGRVTLAGSESATALSRGISDPVVALPEDVQSIYGTRPARYFHNLTQIPDFTVDGPLAREMYRRQTGREVDGVIAIDPVMLSYLLEATGGVLLPDGTAVDADNAVSLFLSDVYKRYSDPAEQDAFFAASSAAIFNAFLDGRGSSAGLIAAFARAVDERRVSLWNARTEEQIIVEGSSMAGQLPSTDAQMPRFGVFLNDGTGSKMSYYVKPDVSLVWDSCQASGERGFRQLTLRANLGNTAPEDAGTSLPWYITGGGVYGVAPGTARVVTNVYLPEGFELVSAQASNGATFTATELAGRSVLTYGADLPPQTAVNVTIVVKGTSSATTAEALVTPTADSAVNPVIRTTCSVPSPALGGSVN
ncbi:DUF4012 domain-containing protein [Microbacterium testaceum]|uniref:DUF4012 domain-containing protein n=1 Tax=Microbacterium testaceum TaxID=2033 RepID=UPI001D17AC63|nr:DUF4012 domain-containing protein [Microbacterium testaceum]MCC4249442.1 DUF4012 domain-containing protein [Microbacterium testaceum]